MGEGVADPQAAIIRLDPTARLAEALWAAVVAPKAVGVYLAAAAVIFSAAAVGGAVVWLGAAAQEAEPLPIAILL